jgi:undecaprenyl-diphosphatase
VIGALIGVAVGSILFGILARFVITGKTDEFDRAVVRALRNPADAGDPRGPRWVEEVGRDMTALGGYAVLTLLTVAASGFLSIQRKHHAALFVAGAAVGGLIAMRILKRIIDRPRPDFVPHLSYVNSASFPSGHSMLSAVIYLTLGVLLTRFVEGRRLKVYIVSIALFLMLCVGISRVYMGVHYPSDVVAGWIAGIVWALLCWLLARMLQRQRALENERTETARGP